MDLDVWGCPVCFSELSEQDDEISCKTQGHTFHRIEGLPILVRPKDSPFVNDSRRHASPWKKTKWAVPRETILELPYRRQSSWRQKARSFHELLAILGPPRGRTLVDVGAGTGWLSYRLAKSGFRCFATDVSSDPDIGLGAATQFDSTPNRFERAIATLDCWPFRAESVDIAICNASLHYAADPRVVIAEAARVLRPAGSVVIMNSPVHGSLGSARRGSQDFVRLMKKLGAHGRLIDDHQHLVATVLESWLRDRFVDVMRHDPKHSFWFDATRAVKSAILAMELASFPIYEARVK